MLVQLKKKSHKSIIKKIIQNLMWNEKITIVFMEKTFFFLKSWNTKRHDLRVGMLWDTGMLALDGTHTDM